MSIFLVSTPITHERPDRQNQMYTDKVGSTYCMEAVPGESLLITYPGKFELNEKELELFGGLGWVDCSTP